MCGVIGILNFNSSNIIIIELLEALKKLQNRGRDSYGILLSNDDENIIIKEKDLITVDKIKQKNLHNNNFKIVLGHSRYSTSYDTTESKNNAKKSHPFKGINCNLGEFFLVHNGNINFNKDITEKYNGLNDTQILVKILEEIKGETWKEIIEKVINDIPGIYNVIIKSSDKIFAFKDRYNMRPLCLGKNKFGFCVASESNALGNYKYVSEVGGGEMLEISNLGINKFKILENQSRICLFEYIYFLNPNSMFNNTEVFNLRYSLGFKLGKEENVINTEKNDIVVIGSPDTGIPSGIGFAESLGLKYQQFLEKNKNRGRSFILGDDSSRAEECKKKFLVNPEFSIKDKIVYFIDDSIVRGNTTKRIINLLKEYGTKEIHIRISSPKIINICKFGIDIPTKEELIMNRMDEKGFEKENNIESLRYLELESMKKVIGNGLNVDKNDFCVGCFSGNYEHKLLDW